MWFPLSQTGLGRASDVKTAPCRAPFSKLFGKFYGAVLADEMHLDLAGIIEVGLDLFGNIAGEQGHLVVEMCRRDSPKAAAILKAEDPETAITLTALRRMVKQGLIPVSMQGNKPLIDVDRLPEYMYATLTQPCGLSAPGMVRAIKE